MMNGSVRSYAPVVSGFYMGNNPVYPIEQQNHLPYSDPLGLTQAYVRNHITHQSYSPAAQDDIDSQQSSETSNREMNMRRPIYTDHFQQQQTANPDVYNFANGGVSSPSTYYKRIHDQVRAKTPVLYQQISTSTNHSTAFTRSPMIHRRTPPIISPREPEQTLFVVPGIETQPTSQLPTSSYPPSFTAPLLVNQSAIPITADGEPSLDYLHYSMDALIQRLVPTDTYIPKQSFIYPMLMCSRLHIRPSRLLNKLARQTISSITNMTRDQSVRTMNNFLFILAQWTRTFPYDFRHNEMMSQLNDLLHKISAYESSLLSDTQYINKKLCSKLKALDHYEEYIRQLNNKALHNLNENALLTDIMNECPTSIMFAQQITHIELDRLKPVGAEELLQYFIMKTASEEASVRPRKHLANANNRLPSSSSSTVDGSLPPATPISFVHDKKSTICLEAYIQWFNRLSFFVTTEIVKHTQRRWRIRVINYFIDAAYECFRMHNFNSMIGILGGLNMQPVRRLKKTWEKIQMDKFRHLEQYTDVSRNFATYRLVLKAAIDDADKHGWIVNKIVIPFTSIILQDVYYIKTHSEDYTTAHGINLKKYYSMAKFVEEEFVRCKQSKCSFERNDVIINYVITSPTFNEDSLMLASFECEPAETSNEKERWKALKASVNMS